MNVVTITTNGPDETVALGRDLAPALRAGAVIALEGPLGSGKTCFVRGLAEGLGIDPREVSSPTFVICQEYGADRPVVLRHVDAYRVNGAEDLDSIGFDEMLAGADGIMAIEWASRIEAALPAERVTIEFAHLGPEQREISVSGPGSWMKKATPLIAAGAPAGAAICPICDATMDPDAAHAPFCSSRCRTIDLGRWLGGKYFISREVTGDDLEE